MNRTTTIILRVVGVLVLLVATAVVGFIGWLYITNRTFDQTLVTDLNVSSEWTEIPVDPPLQTRRQVTELVMTIPDYKNNRRGVSEITLPDGRMVQPQIEVIDTEGNIHHLKHSGFAYTGYRDLIIFTPKGGFPDTTYRQVRIRSDVPFTCGQISWRERNPK